MRRSAAATRDSWASHGTEECYEERARITRRLIAEKHFCAVAVEADWPDAYRVNRYVRSQGEDANADMALAGFKRFPTWMWRLTATMQGPAPDDGSTRANASHR
jgi:erythromycin esterase-like protein